jgi:hypothetical protein
MDKKEALKQIKSGDLSHEKSKLNPHIKLR